jgi:hypothetical protein
MASEAVASRGSGRVLSPLFEDITEAWEEAEASSRKKQRAATHSDAHARFATTMRIRDLHDRTQSDLAKERVFALDGMTIGDALKCKVPFQDADGHETVEMLTMCRLMSDVESGLIELEEVVPATAGAFPISRPSELSDGDVQKLVDKIMSAPNDYRLMMPPAQPPDCRKDVRKWMYDFSRMYADVRCFGGLRGGGGGGRGQRFFLAFA